ncbi:hypothetical protein [Nocardiopsis lucentensis]|uniref:hypothetical protein n=1 Tax=Nocardiopsis lucentensis TaxID=53441 RepID=UPI000344E4A3|nr:hypothetical protein [Nocardiopsis lucentensis]
MPRRRSPQEKKLLTYTRERRNEYGENDKSSRRNIARSKRLVTRANRRRASVALADARGAADTEAGAAAQERFERRRPKRWAKYPDEPLGDSIELTLRYRVEAEEGRGANVERLRRLRERLRRPDR